MWSWQAHVGDEVSVQVLRRAKGAVQEAQAPQELERQRDDAEGEIDAEVVVRCHVRVRCVGGLRRRSPH